MRQPLPTEGCVDGQCDQVPYQLSLRGIFLTLLGKYCPDLNPLFKIEKEGRFLSSRKGRPISKVLFSPAAAALRFYGIDQKFMLYLSLEWLPGNPALSSGPHVCVLHVCWWQVTRSWRGKLEGRLSRSLNS